MRIRLHLKIFIFILIFIITRQIWIYSILMLFAFLHEMGHIIAGIILGFKPVMLEIMPFGLSVAFEGKIDNYNKKIGKTSLLTLKKLIIAISGPLTNLFLVFIFLNIKINNINIGREELIYSNIILCFFNLIPIYPLDGGRILKCIFKFLFGNEKANDIVNNVSYITIILLTAISSIVILYLKNIFIIVILSYLWYLVIIEKKRYQNRKKLYKKIKYLNDIL